ncbi:MAG TPA: Gmad2 immunoglobulin-like domain-containing protein [Nocardioides sp.]|nr:Gmad2 immunoglobulin-like domain-containing protein [Nocardioides sp.]
MDDLGTLMRDAVEHVDPMPRQRELWDGVNVATKRRTRNRTVGGLVAAAVLLTGGALVAHQSSGSEPEPLGPPRAVDPGASRTVYGIYYVGSTPTGPRLYREFRAGPDNQEDLADALSLIVSRPSDPDYRSYWSEGQLLGATVENGVIQVDVDPSLTHRSDAPDGGLALQQLIYTVQGVEGAPRLPVQFVHDGNPVSQVFGQPTSEPLTNSPELDVLALASISDPSERRVVVDEFSARGVASSFEGNVPWELKDADGTVVLQGSAQTYGYVDRLYPWATGRIDVSHLDPGEYTFVVMTDDPSGGEGPGPTVDTRTLILK